MNKLTKVTAEDIAEAEDAIRAGEKRLDALRNAFYNGTGEWQAVKDQEAVLEYANANLIRQEVAKRQYDEQVRTQQIADLRTKILTEAPKNGDRLTALLKSWCEQTQEIVNICGEHSAWVRATAAEANTLGIPDKGVPSSEHAGLASNAGGDLLVDGITIRALEASQLLSWFFHKLGNGIVPTGDQTLIDHAFAAVANMGKDGK